MLTPDFAFKQTITLERWLRRDVNADVFSEPEELPCRVNFKRQHSHSGTQPQESVYASGSVWFSAGTRIDAKDRLTFDGKQYKVLDCLPSYDVMGRENHVEVSIQ